MTWKSRAFLETKTSITDIPILHNSPFFTRVTKSKRKHVEYVFVMKWASPRVTGLGSSTNPLHARTARYLQSKGPRFRQNSKHEVMEQYFLLWHQTNTILNIKRVTVCVMWKHKRWKRDAFCMFTHQKYFFHACQWCRPKQRNVLKAPQCLTYEWLLYSISIKIGTEKRSKSLHA